MSACDEEPCKSLIDRYWATAIDGWEAQLAVRLHCDLLKRAERDYWILFSLWAAAFAYAVACAALGLPAPLCAALTLASFALLAALAVWTVRIARLRRLLARYQEACRRRYSEMLSLRRQIAVRCPRECQPEAVRIECGC